MNLMQGNEWAPGCRRSALVSTSYLWRCPECAVANVVNSMLLEQVCCDTCRASFPVHEVRHRTNDLDLLPGRSPGALEDHAAAQRAAWWKAGRREMQLVPGGGVLLVASGYTWNCPSCSAEMHIRSPLDIGQEENGDLNLVCPTCGSSCASPVLQHSHAGQTIGPGIPPQALYMPQLSFGQAS